jgi:RNA polymerase sigma-70 factor (ECF subfamily)
VDKQGETELARALLAGETNAFERFVEHFRGKVFHYSWVMCGSPEDAEEVAQETLLKAFESFDQLREPERVRAWVFRIARNVCLMQRRKSVFAPAHELSLDELPPGDEVPDGGRAPEGQLLRTELRAVIDRVIVELPPSYRAVVLKRPRRFSTWASMWSRRASTAGALRCARSWIATLTITAWKTSPAPIPRL